MTDNRSLLTNFIPVGVDKWTVSGIGGARLAVEGQGDVTVTSTVNGKTLSGMINSLSTCNKTNGLLTNDPITGMMRGVLYVPGLGINLYSIGHATAACLDAAQVKPLSLWHQRFGHLNLKTLLKMASIGSATGLALFNDQTHSAIHCRGCLLGKMHRIPFSSTRIRAT